MNLGQDQRPRAATGREGFALLITITLLAFLVLLLVSLAALTRVETQVAANSQQLSLARQHAIFGLNVAIGRLQELAGPDQRVTATADMAAGRHPSKLHWTGVWNADESHDDYGDNIGWLVSGKVPVGIAGATGDLVSSADNPLVTLVGENTGGTADPDNLIEVIAEPIKSSTVPGLSGERTIGRFAYWVGDEGVKARITLVDPWAGSTDAAERRYSFINMQRTGVELVDASDVTKIGTAYTPNANELTRVLSLGQFALTGPAAGNPLPAAVRNRFHDLTTVSSTVLADVARGGLKKDLTNWIHFGATPAAREQDDTPMVIIDDETEDLPDIPRWGLLRSFATTRDTGDAIPPREQTRVAHGIAPVLTYFRFGVNISAQAGDPLQIHLFPTAVLWNPHSVPLAHVDESGSPVVYQVAWKENAGRVLRFAPANDPAPITGSPKRSILPLGGSYYVFDIELTEPIPPGRSLVFTLKPPSGGGDTVPYVPGGGTVLVNRPFDGTSAVVDGLVYSDADLVDGMVWNISSVGGGAMDFLLRLKPSSTTAPQGDGQTTGEYLAVQEKGYTTHGRNSITLLRNDLLIAIEPRFAFDTYVRMGGPSTGGAFRWIANQNYRARFSPRPDLDGDSHSVYFGGHGGATSNQALQPLSFDEGGSRASAGTTVTLAVGEAARDLVLAEVPPTDAVLTSLAQFQHANLSLLTQYPGYAVGNAIASPYVPLDTTAVTVDEVAGYTEFHDISYLLNRELWDRYFLSTVPATFGATDLADPNHHLPNARHAILRDNGTPDVVALRGQAAFDTAAAHLLVNGGFNVNSTSVQAWRAFLAGHLGIETDGSNRHPFSRFIAPASPVNEAWAGYRNLSDEQINRLAWNIVQEVKRRGPFLSLADFVNRRLVVRGPDPNDTQRYKGTLQAAIDTSDTETTTPAEEPPIAPINTSVQDSLTASEPFKASLVTNKPLGTGWLLEAYQGGATRQLPYSSRSAFAPGYLTQADLLTAIGPALTARSDTFVIRSYGDVRNPVTEALEGRAWCEAVVQRLPEPMTRKNTTPSHPDYNEPAAATSGAPDFGRRFKIVSFRWLSADEI